MQEIMRLAHEFLQNFCAGNQQNQALLHKHINLFLNPGVRRGSGCAVLGRAHGGAACSPAAGPSGGHCGQTASCWDHESVERVGMAGEGAWSSLSGCALGPGCSAHTDPYLQKLILTCV